MISDYLTEEVTIKHAPAADKWGEPTAGSARSHVPAFFAPSSRIFTTGQGEQVQATGVYTFVAGTEIGYNDRIVDEDDREYRPIQIRRPHSLDGEELVRVYVA
ncbi:MAG: hypothetical protein ACREUF_06270 [Solimonas sp.]